MIIIDKIQQQYNNKLPFVAYSKPDSNNLLAYFLNSDDLVYTNNLSESGFVFAPFLKSDNIVLFNSENSQYLEEEISISDSIKNSEIDKNDSASEFHIELVQKTIEEIQKGTIKKIVISRKEEVQLIDFDLLKIFKNLLLKYKNALVYAWYHPKVGLWLGATPETLLSIEDNIFTTMSLAGTQQKINDEEPNWSLKEYEEQQLVTDYIERQLSLISSELNILPRQTTLAGSLWHLKTKINGVLKKEKRLYDLVYKLHPTPAICGFPKEEARTFILQNENYDRTFYTGFLGELNIKTSNSTKSNLFVNLRCMNIKSKIANLFIGGGITKDSNAQREWLETVAKSQTMKTIL